MFPLVVFSAFGVLVDEHMLEIEEEVAEIGRNPAGGVSWLWRPNDIANRSGEDTPAAGGAFGSGGQAMTGGAAGAAEQEAPTTGT